MPTYRPMLKRSALVAAALVLLSILMLDGPLAIAFSSIPTEAKRLSSTSCRLRMAVRLSAHAVPLRWTAGNRRTCCDGEKEGPGDIGLRWLDYPF